MTIKWNKVHRKKITITNFYRSEKIFFGKKLTFFCANMFCKTEWFVFQRVTALMFQWQDRVAGKLSKKWGVELAGQGRQKQLNTKNLLFRLWRWCFRFEEDILVEEFFAERLEDLCPIRWRRSDGTTSVTCGSSTPTSCANHKWNTIIIQIPLVRHDQYDIVHCMIVAEFARWDGWCSG